MGGCKQPWMHRLGTGPDGDPWKFHFCCFPSAFQALAKLCQGLVGRPAAVVGRANGQAVCATDLAGSISIRETPHSEGQRP